MKSEPQRLTTAPGSPSNSPRVIGDRYSDEVLRLISSLNDNGGSIATDDHHRV
jgi:hypothetical protein